MHQPIMDNPEINNLKIVKNKPAPFKLLAAEWEAREYHFLNTLYTYPGQSEEAFRLWCAMERLLRFTRRYAKIVEYGRS